MNSIFNNRRLYRTIVLYLGSSWVIIEASNYFADRFAFPEYYIDILIILIGFGLVLFIFNELFTSKDNVDKKGPLPIFVNGTILIIAAASTYFYWQDAVKKEIQHTRFDRAETSIAVLPFKNLSPDSSYYWISDGICEQLRSQLDQIESIDVKSRSASEYFKDKDFNPVQIAGLLGINTMLDGSIMVVDSLFRINITLSNPINGSQILNETFNGKLSNIFDLQSEIALKVAERINAQVTTEEKSKITADLTNNPDALELYLKGKYHFNMVTLVDNIRANDYFSRAIELDEGFLMAHFYYGMTYDMFGGMWLGITADSAYRKIDDIVQKIYEKDAYNAAAKFLESNSLFFYHREYDRGINLATDAFNSLENKEDIIWIYTMMLSINRQAEKSILILEDYIAKNPTSAQAYQGLCHARVMLKGRDPSTPIEYINEPCNKCMELDRSIIYGKYYLAEVHFMRKEFEESRQYWQELVETYPIPMFYEGVMRTNYYLGDTTTALEYYKMVLMGEKHGIPASPIQMARVYSTLNEIDSVEKYLNLAFIKSDIELVALWNEPVFDIMRNEDRFQKIANKLGNAGSVAGGKTIFDW